MVPLCRKRGTMMLTSRWAIVGKISQGANVIALGIVGSGALGHGGRHDARIGAKL